MFEGKIKEMFQSLMSHRVSIVCIVNSSAMENKHTNSLICDGLCKNMELKNSAAEAVFLLCSYFFQTLMLVLYLQDAVKRFFGVFKQFSRYVCEWKRHSTAMPKYKAWEPSVVTKYLRLAGLYGILNDMRRSFRKRELHCIHHSTQTRNKVTFGRWHCTLHSGDCALHGCDVIQASSNFQDCSLDSVPGT